MKNVKRFYIVLASVMATVCFFLGSIAFIGNATGARAEAVSEKEGFYVEKGAAIRLKEGESGIRFSTVVTKEYYDGLIAKYGEDATVEFYTVIGAGETYKNPIEYKAKAPVFTDGVYNYREVIYYDNLESDLTAKYEREGKTGEELDSLVQNGIKKAYATELNAKACVKITANGETVTVDAYKTDNLRSLRGVALDLLNSGDYKPEQKTVLESYMGGQLVSSEIHGKDAYYDNSALKGTVTTENLPAGDYAVYCGAKKVATTSVSASEETVDVSGIQGLVDGKDYTLAFYNEETNTVYNRSFKAVTKIITEASDLSVFRAIEKGSEFGGYYVLGNDIDASSYTHTSAIANISAETEILPNGTLRGLTGVFDGLGHTISGLKLDKCSLFGTVFNGTVKNVAFKNVVMTGADTAVIAWYTYGGKIENVFVSVNSLPEVWNRATFAGKINTTTQVNNVVIELTNTPSGVYGGYGSFTCGYKEPNENSDNVFVISKTPLTVTASKTYDGDNTGAGYVYNGVKRYNDYGEFAKANNDYASFRESGVWNTEGDYPVFNGMKAVKTVDGVINYATADGFTAEDYTAIFGAESVEILSVTDNTSGYAATVSDNKLTFTCDGKEFTGDGTVHNVILSTANVDYSVSLKVVTKILRQKEDLSIFKINDKVGEFNGYYLLANDIDATGYTCSTGASTDLSGQSERWFATAGYGACGLKGTFDGNGHTISNLTVGQFGIFGVINGGTVKDVALKDLKYTNQSNIATLAWFILDAKIENVYMSAETLPDVWARAMVASSIYQSSVNNVVIKLGEVLKNTGNNLNVFDSGYGAYGSFVSSNASVSNETIKANEFKDVYVISTTKLSVLSSSIFDGENKDDANRYVGIKRYDTEEEMAEAGNDYSSFIESGKWTVNGNGVLAFKG